MGSGTFWLRRPPRSAWLGAIGFAVACTGCSLFASIFGHKTPNEMAQKIEPRCRNFADANAEQVLSPGAIDSVEPAYSFVQSGNDRRANLQGARLHVKPLPGLSPEAMTRALECHQAGVVLAGTEPRTDDPYCLPGRWVDLDVASESDGFVIVAHVSSIDDAQLVLKRAKRFVSAEGKSL